eukprot:462705-Pelagomonas_calceolata.AAC.6
MYQRTAIQAQRLAVHALDLVLLDPETRPSMHTRKKCEQCMKLVSTVVLLMSAVRTLDLVLLDPFSLSSILKAIQACTQARCARTACTCACMRG